MIERLNAASPADLARVQREIQDRARAEAPAPVLGKNLVPGSLTLGNLGGFEQMPPGLRHRF